MDLRRFISFEKFFWWYIFFPILFILFQGLQLHILQNYPRGLLCSVHFFFIFLIHVTIWVFSVHLFLNSHILSSAVSVYYLIHWILHFRYLIFQYRIFIWNFRTPNSVMKFPICSFILSIFSSKFLNIFMIIIFWNPYQLILTAGAIVNLPLLSFFLLIIGEFSAFFQSLNFKCMLDIFKKQKSSRD